MGWSREETNGTWRVGRMELMNFPPLVFVMRTHPDGPLYRATMVVRDMGLVGLTMILGVPLSACLVLPRQMGVWQNWLGNWARWWNIPNQGQPNPTPSTIVTLYSPLSLAVTLRLLIGETALGERGLCQEIPFFVQSPIPALDVICIAGTRQEMGRSGM